MQDALMQASIRIDAYAALGLEPPAAAARAHAVYTAAYQAATADPLAGIDYDGLTEDNAPELLREAALTKAVKTGMRELLVEVGDRLGAIAWRALSADLDRAIDVLRPQVLEAASVVTGALEAGLTADVYRDGAKVLWAGPAAAAVFHRCRDAGAYLTTVRGFARAASPPGATVATFITLTGEADATTLETAEALFTGPGSEERWLAVYAVPGVAPALHTTEHARAVLAASGALKAAAKAERDAIAREASEKYARSWRQLGAPKVDDPAPAA